MRVKKKCDCGKSLERIYARPLVYGRKDFIPMGWFCTSCKRVYLNENFGGYWLAGTVANEDLE